VKSSEHGGLLCISSQASAITLLALGADLAPGRATRSPGKERTDMESSQFDKLTKALATSTSRRQALKAIAATTIGGILGLSGVGNVFAKSCTPNGRHCNRKTVCCSGYCSPTTDKCTCPPAPACSSLCPCPSGQTCQNGTCGPTCPMGCTQLSNGTMACRCTTAADCTCGVQFCGSDVSLGLAGVCTASFSSTNACSGDSDCATGYYCNGGGFCTPACGC
jgi:hypothetical protein